MSKKVTTLGMIADIITGPFGSQLHMSDYVAEGIPVIMPQNIGNRIVIENGIAKISEENYKRLIKYAVHKDDLVFSRRGDVEKHAFISKSEQALCGTGCLRVRIKCDKVYPLFLSFFLSRYETKKWLASHAVGSNMPNINTEILSTVPVELPDYETQVKIADILQLLDSKILSNCAVCDSLEQMAKTIYDYWFLQFDFPDESGNPYRQSGGKMVWNEELKREIPEGWETISLQNNYFVDRGVSYTSEDIASSDGIPMLNLACVDANRKYRDGQLKYTKGSVPPDKKLHGGEMLIACTDLTRNRDIIGCPILVPADGLEYTYSMDLARVKSSNKNLLDMYLYQTLRTEFYHDYIKMWASGTNVLHLNLKGLDWYSVVLPPLELQEIYSKVVMTVHEKYSKALAENRQLLSLRNFLLPMLMNGQARVV